MGGCNCTRWTSALQLFTSLNKPAGYFTAGVIFKPHSRLTAYAGYSIGNANLSNGNHFFLVELGYNFN